MCLHLLPLASVHGPFKFHKGSVWRAGCWRLSGSGVVTGSALCRMDEAVTSCCGFLERRLQYTGCPCMAAMLLKSSPFLHCSSLLVSACTPQAFLLPALLSNRIKAFPPLTSGPQAPGSSVARKVVHLQLAVRKLRLPRQP